MKSVNALNIEIIETIEEINILRRLNSPFIIQYLDCFREYFMISIITEEISLLECKSLDKFRAIPRRDQCYSTEVLFIFRGIAQHISGFLFCITDQILFKPKIFFDKKISSGIVQAAGHKGTWYNGI